MNIVLKYFYSLIKPVLFVLLLASIVYSAYAQHYKKEFDFFNFKWHEDHRIVMCKMNYLKCQGNAKFHYCIALLVMGQQRMSLRLSGKKSHTALTTCFTIPHISPY